MNISENARLTPEQQGALKFFIFFSPILFFLPMTTFRGGTTPARRFLNVDYTVRKHIAKFLWKGGPRKILQHGLRYMSWTLCCKILRGPPFH